MPTISHAQPIADTRTWNKFKTTLQSGPSSSTSELFSPLVELFPVRVSFVCNPTCWTDRSLGLDFEGRNSSAFSIPVAPVERSCANVRVFNTDYSHLLTLSVLRAFAERFILDICGQLCLTIPVMALCLNQALADISLWDVWPYFIVYRLSSSQWWCAISRSVLVT